MQVRKAVPRITELSFALDRGREINNPANLFQISKLRLFHFHAFCLWVIFLNSAVSSLIAQDAKSHSLRLKTQLAEADSLYKAENYFDAVTEYERLLLFDTLHEFSVPALTHEGMAYRNGGRYEEAAECFGKALVHSDKLDEITGIKTELIKVLLIDKKFTSAYNVIQELERDNRLNDRKFLNYWKGWLWLMQDEWPLAAEFFGKCDTAEYLKNFCLDVHNKKYPVSFVKLISVFIPGGGAIYTGHVFQGLVSLGWNALFGYLTVKAFADKRILDGVLIGDLLLLRFYSGSLEISEKYATEENLEITNNALKYLAKEFQGAKP